MLLVFSCHAISSFYAEELATLDFYYFHYKFKPVFFSFSFIIFSFLIL